MVERQFPGHTAVNVQKHSYAEIVHLHKQICRCAEHASAAADFIKWDRASIVTGQKMRES
ncbi:Uncharacterised protein [Salmonella enterica subsp. enterica serovar Typhi]|nr:Uncharacterised protein [Salmonella enterica subsp. enterica serovar Typhi]CRF89636.1 Uncharacterised protein [Salmonella enterica subsp. enterica serovar Typhi]